MDASFKVRGAVRFDMVLGARGCHRRILREAKYSGLMQACRCLEQGGQRDSGSTPLVLARFLAAEADEI